MPPDESADGSLAAVVETTKTAALRVAIVSVEDGWKWRCGKLNDEVLRLVRSGTSHDLVYMDGIFQSLPGM